MKRGAVVGPGCVLLGNVAGLMMEIDARQSNESGASTRPVIMNCRRAAAAAAAAFEAKHALPSPFCAMMPVSLPTTRSGKQAVTEITSLKSLLSAMYGTADIHPS